MAIMHMHISMVSGGRSAVAAAAYRAGDTLNDERYGVTQDYSRKRGIMADGIMLPANAPAEYADRETLWNAAQNAEKNGGQYAREVEVGLPRELSPEQQARLLADFVEEQFVSKGMCADIAMHDKGDGNPHAHILLTTRAIGEDGRWLPKCKSVYKLDKDGQRIPVLDRNGNQKIGKNRAKQWQRETVRTTDWDDRGNAERWRAGWAEACNRFLAADRQIDHRSYRRQGRDTAPTIHEGYSARAIERRGGRADRCEYNRTVRAINGELREIGAEATLLTIREAASARVNAAGWVSMFDRRQVSSLTPSTPASGGPGRKPPGRAPGSTMAEQFAKATRDLKQTVGRMVTGRDTGVPAASGAPAPRDDDTPFSALTQSAKQERAADRRFNDDWDEDEEAGGIKPSSFQPMLEDEKPRKKPQRPERQQQQQRRQSPEERRSIRESNSARNEAEAAKKEIESGRCTQQRLDHLRGRMSGLEFNEQCKFHAEELRLSSGSGSGAHQGAAAAKPAAASPVAIAAGAALVAIKLTTKAISFALETLTEHAEVQQDVNARQDELVRTRTR